jgi:hypothetical protein
VVLVDCLAVVWPSNQRRSPVLNEANNGLDADQAECHHANDAVDGLESLIWVWCLVELDHDDACHKSANAQEVKSRMCPGAVSFLFLCGRWLNDENGLHEEEHTGGLE